MVTDPPAVVGPGQGSPDEVAVLDADGVIVRVNEAWERFRAENGGSAAACGVGASYLQVCEAAAALAPDGPDARMAEALRAALDGGALAPRRLLLPCHTADRRRWFETSVSSRLTDGGDAVGATVVLHEVPIGIDVSGEWAVLDATPDGLMIVDGSGRIVWANAAVYDLSGYGSADLVGRTVEVLVPPSSQAAHVELRDHYVHSPVTRTMGEGRSLTLQRADGALVPVEVGLRAISAGGEPMVLAAIRDLSERVRAAERELVVTAALDSINDAVSVVDPRSGERLYANRAALEFTGRSFDESRHLPVGALADDEGREELRVAIGRVTSQDVAEAVLTARFPGRHGRPVPLEIRVSPVPGHLTERALPASGRAPDDLVILVGRDITERLEAQQRLEVSETFMRAVFDHTPIGAFLFGLDPSGRRTILRGNPAAADLLAVPPDGLTGRDLEEFLFPEDRDRDRELGRELAALTRPGYAGERRMRRLDGRPLWVDLHLSVVDLPGIGRTLLGHMIDITYRHEMERLAREQSALNALRAQVTAAVLGARPMAELLDLVVTGVSDVFEASDVSLGHPDPVTGDYRIAAATGPVAAQVADGTLPLDHALARRFAQQGRSRIAPDELRESRRPEHGPGAAVRFPGEGASAALIVAVRPVGAPPFSDAELELLSGLGRQVQVALELNSARADRQRLALLEDRQRIGRDLHDTVIQDLIALGMQLGTQARHTADPEQRERVDELVHLTDQAVRRLRGTVFDLRHDPGRGPLAVTLSRLVDEAARVLGFRPVLTVTGPVGDLPDQIADAVVAVLREALSNVARHAEATAAAVKVSVTPGRSPNGLPTVRLVIEDDGVGMSGSRRGDGLDNICARAAEHHGTATWTRPAAGGTRLTWRCSLAPGNEGADRPATSRRTR